MCLPCPSRRAVMLQLVTIWIKINSCNTYQQKHFPSVSKFHTTVTSLQWISIGMTEPICIKDQVTMAFMIRSILGLYPNEKIVGELMKFPENFQIVPLVHVDMKSFGLNCK